MPRSGKEHRSPQRGANGRWPIANRTIAADKSIPFGTIVLISHKGKIFEMEVGDRGHAIVDGRFDIFMATCDQAKRFGRREVHAKIIDGR